MKVFFKIVLGNLLALCLFGAVALFIVGGMVASLFMSEQTPVVETGSVLVFDMTANITDGPPVAEFGQLIEQGLGRSTVPTYSLRTVTASIRAGAQDKRISALFLYGNLIPEGYGSGFAALREVRAAVEEFGKSGKPVVAYLESPTVREYYIASVAGKIVLNPYGVLGVNGLASPQIFMAGLLEKYGVGVQVTKAGRYKSAVEAFTETEMSASNRQQTEELLTDLWREIVLRVSESRGIPAREIQRLTDEHGFINRDLAMESGLVDQIGYFDEVLEELRLIVGGESGVIFPQITLADYSGIVVKPSTQAGEGSNQIAVLYLEGDIVDGEGGSGSVGGNRFAREIRRLRTQGDVHAIVVRVNSPGGSVTAAETIQRELSLARDQMPVIVSCGSYAASGGYWVATEADQIFAHPNTVTGSIGVFGILPNVQELANRHGVTFDTVRTGTYADLFSMVRPKTEEEMALIQDVVDEIYVDFVTRVATGRDMSLERAESLAQGRVWSGEQALENGLVDQIGGLDDAIGFAAQQAGLKKWELYEFPRAVAFGEVLAEIMAPQQPPLIRYPMQDFVREMQGEVRALQLMNDPRGIYARMPFSLRIQ